MNPFKRLCQAISSAWKKDLEIEEILYQTEAENDFFAFIPKPIRKFFTVLVISLLILLIVLLFYCSTSRSAASNMLQNLLSSAPSAVVSGSQDEISFEVLSKTNYFFCFTPDNVTDRYSEALEQSPDLLSLLEVASEQNSFIEPKKLRLSKLSSSGDTVTYHFTARLDAVSSKVKGVAAATGTIELTKIKQDWKVSALSFTLQSTDS